MSWLLQILFIRANAVRKEVKKIYDRNQWKASSIPTQKDI